MRSGRVTAAPVGLARRAGRVGERPRGWPREGSLGALAAWAVVIVAGVLRLARLDLVEFHTDQAAALRRAEDLVHLGRLPLVGARSSQGLFLEPHFAYLLAPFVAISRDPALASGAVAAADLAAVGGTLWLGWRAFGPLAGLVAAGLYAASPSAVLYARRIWEPDLHPVLAVLLFVALERGVLERRAWWAAATFPIVMLGVGVHYIFLLLAPVALVPAAVLARRRRWLPLGVGLASALLLTLPLLLHLQATDLQDYRDARYRATLPARVDLDGLTFVLRAPTSWDAPAAEVLPLADILPPSLAQALPALSMALLLGGIALTLARVAQPGLPTDLRARLAGLLVWLLLPAALTVRHQADLHPHYYLMTLPASFLLIGGGVAWLASWFDGLSRRRRAPRVVAMGLAVLVSLQSLAVGRLLDLVAATPEACYGAPLVVTRQTAAELLAFGGSSPRVVFENDEVGDASALAYLVRPGFAELQVPRPDLAGLTGPNPGAWPGGLAFETATGSLARSAERLEVTYGNSVHLLRASLAEDPWPGWRPRLAMNWWVEPSATGPVEWQAELVGADGVAVASQLGQRHVPNSLGGQQVVSWFTFDVPPGLAAGEYQARLRLLGAPGEWLSRPMHLSAPPVCSRTVIP